MQWIDNQNRVWNCRLTIGDAKRLRAAGYDVGDMRSFHKAFSSALECIEIIAEILRPQWHAQGLDYESFVDLITDRPGTLERLQQCVVEGLLDFFQRIGEPAKARIVEKTIEAAERAKHAELARANSPRVGALIDRAMDAADAEFLRALAAEEAKLSGGTSTSAQES